MGADRDLPHKLQEEQLYFLVVVIVNFFSVDELQLNICLCQESFQESKGLHGQQKYYQIAKLN